MLNNVNIPTLINTRPANFKPKLSTPNSIDAPPARSILTIATALLRPEIHRFCSQFLINGPKRSLLSNRRCHFSEDRAKNQADNNRKGVPGRIGNRIPRTARPRKRNPRGL